MQELKVLRWCDQCHDEDGALVLAADPPYVIAINAPGIGRPMTPRRLDLCDRHLKPVTDIQDLALKLGVAADGDPEKKPGPNATKTVVPPPVVPTTTDQAEPNAPHWGAERTACPSAARTSGAAPRRPTSSGCTTQSCPRQPRKCPDCGEAYSHDRVQSMVTHRRRMHGYDYLAEMLASVPPGKRR